MFWVNKTTTIWYTQHLVRFSPSILAMRKEERGARRKRRGSASNLRQIDYQETTHKLNCFLGENFPETREILSEKFHSSGVRKINKHHENEFITHESKRHDDKMIRTFIEIIKKIKQSVSEKGSQHILREFFLSFRLLLRRYFSLAPRLLDGVTLRVISELLFSRSAIRQKSYKSW